MESEELVGSQELEGSKELQGSAGSETKEPPPNWSTFYRRWKQVWRHVLRIRKSSQHAECSICFKFRQEMRQARKDVDAKVRLAQAWRHHLYWQYCDRCVYWSLRFASRARGDVLVVFIDALDRSKFMLPKYTVARKSHDLDKLTRPRVIITGGLAHGYCRHAFVSSEEKVKGASMFIEMLARIIEDVYKLRGGTLPSHLVVFTDNTVAQAKNCETNMFLAHFVARCHFRSANLLMLTEGHTHEDIDQFLGLIVQVVLRKHAFETPADVVDLCKLELSPLCQDRGEACYAMELHGSRTWKVWVGGIGAELHGGFGTRKGLWAPHSFTYKMRQDLLSHERRQLQESQESQEPEHRHPHHQDVFCLVKVYIHDEKLSQPPLLVFPEEFLPRIVGPYPPDLTPVYELSKMVRDNYLKLATELRKPHHNYPNAADYIEGLCQNRAGAHVQLRRFAWLRQDVFCRPPVTTPTGNQHYEHLPQSTWRWAADLKW